MKKVYSLFCLFFAWNLEAASIIALLKSVENNNVLHMHYKKTPFVCVPYGVETVDELMLRMDSNSSCMRYLQDFRRAHPKEKFFAASSLHVQQQYSVEGMDGECLLYLSSEHTYSEALLEKGYGRRPVGYRYKDVILKHRFKDAVKRAQITKAGIWSDVNIRNCFLMTTEKK